MSILKALLYIRVVLRRLNDLFSVFSDVSFEKGLKSRLSLSD